MPTYDYICAACAHAFEQFQTMSAKKLRRCPKCKKQALERQVGTGAGLIFKGTGFYITDYRKAEAPRDSESVPAGAKGEKSDKGAKGDTTDRAEKPERGDKQDKRDKQDKGEAQHKQSGASKPASDAKGSVGGAPPPATPSEKPPAAKRTVRPGRAEEQ